MHTLCIVRDEKNTEVDLNIVQNLLKIGINCKTDKLKISNENISSPKKSCKPDCAILK